MLRRIVLAALLTTWFFPPAAQADVRVSEPQRSARPGLAAPPPGAFGTDAEARRLAEREQQAQNLLDFEGGSRVSTGTIIIILLLVIIILILI
jgi:hypothetical protein